MPKLIFDESGKLIASATGETSHIEGNVVEVEELPKDLSDLKLAADGSVVKDFEGALKRIQTERKARIKHEAAKMISDLDWRVTRAHERAELGVMGEEPELVLREREAIRRASNRAEKEVDKMVETSAIQLYTWEVTKSDYPPKKP
ncbi:hypothetical protein COW20_15340 [bacterium (Candidatus Blackallbacteria) CG13_big_fil_rev_8_21_14_2_50_49_14]|nr:MAG: hypothetical protein COW64_15180 [bacterium (Candidatus Blackallbacteria) CG18_big_fil_WC_8_21_14_2_50_49_26]PIW46661.1 MAG: hypothetical protein COW20_15340 [bacterium (Candidatus Blackallbacteria) CG13_big_fil_rev_8_21_14_2_50_49_14]